MDYTIIEKAKQGATIRSFFEMEGKAQMVAIVEKAAAIRGDKLDKGQAEVTAAALYDRIMQRYPALTINEMWLAISEAFYSGKRVYRVNAVDLFIAIDTYVNSEEHKHYCYVKAHQGGNALQLPVHIETQEERDKAARELIRSDYEMMKEHKRLLPPTFITPRGTFCYDYLERAGRIHAGAWTKYRNVPLPEGDKFAKALDGTLPDEVLCKYKCYIAYLKHITNKTSNTNESK